MNKIIETMGNEALKTLSKVYGKSEAEIIDAALAGNEKVLEDLRKLVSSVVMVA